MQSRDKKLVIVPLIMLLMLYYVESARILSFGSWQWPILWIGAVLAVLMLPRVKAKSKLRHREFVSFWAFNLGAVYVLGLVIAGLIFGFGASPYSRSLSGMFSNVIIIGSALVGREFIRSYFVNISTGKKKFLSLALVTVIMTVTSFSFSRFTGLGSTLDLIQFIAQYLMPELTVNFIATYLAFLGGPLPAVIYIGIIQVFHWLSPVLPDPPWVIASLIGVFIPILSYVFFERAYLKERKHRKQMNHGNENPLSWMATAIACIFIIWFAIGVFPIYPSVVLTGSMRPEIEPGDLIMVKKCQTSDSIESLTVGDVIQFKHDDILVSHRIIERVEQGGGLAFRTQGDGNPIPDRELVKPEQIRGQIVSVVPKLGWPTLWIRQQHRGRVD